ncbi:MAG TPA: protein kinase, partial [Candidatus Nocardiopsis merdipullorum]|nr:protein kinase [Candidatus Nocardiopsis merdipullorum]
MRRRFSAEVEQARKVSGFCVAAIVDADPEAAEPWIATEYIEGPTLQSAVGTDGPREGAELQRLAVSTATALAAIHAAGVVHRDLKPDNIMLAADGPRVIDFGIARAVESTSVTASGVIGTIGYMAPEQLEGTRLSSAVDIFAWSSVMVFAATGQEAFPGPTQAARIARVLSGRPVLDGVPAPLDETIRACLAPTPEARPEARALLEHLVTGQPLEAVAPGPPVPPTRIEGIPVTRTHTRLVPAEERADAELREPGSPEESGEHVTPAPSPVTEGAYATPRPAPSSGNTPPYHFAGVRFTRLDTLVAALQKHWSQAVRILGDPVELAALGEWIMHDLGDTQVDRSLFRRKISDTNLALATLISQARPDLPPIFRGHDCSVAGLSELFADPRPILSGDPRANELGLLARPDVLRVMAEHDGPDRDRLRQLAHDLDEAERVGAAFHRELAQGLSGWRGTHNHVDPAVVLVFLLHPGRIREPDSGNRPEVADWTTILWTRVESATGVARTGYAAAVYGALRTVNTLARQRSEWERRRDRLHRDQQELRTQMSAQSQYLTSKLGLGCGTGFCLCIGLVLFMFGTAEMFGLLITGVVLLLLGVACALGLVAVSVQQSNRQGDSRTRAHSAQQYYDLPKIWPTLDSGIQMIHEDLRRAEQICARTERP